MSTKKICHVVPPDELRCVWMTAGVLSYQLCEHQFNCEDCPLDSAMRRHVAPGTPLPAASAGRVGRSDTRERLRTDRKYSENHCWVKRMDEGIFQVGLEPRLCEVFLALKAIVFPACGHELQRGQRCLWLVMEGGTLPLGAPIGGFVRSINHHLCARPYLLGAEPFDQGWLYTLQVESAAWDTAPLMEADQASSRYAADDTAFVTRLAGALSADHTRVGATMADGGEPLRNLADMLGPDKYFAIVKKFYS